MFVEEIFAFLVGLGLVCWGADVFVSGASRLAVLMKISPMLVAVTVVAFASSAPELFVSLQAAIDSPVTNHDKSMGNIIGSNICNIALVVGLCSIVSPFKMDKKFLSKEFVFFVASAALLLFFMISDTSLSGGFFFEKSQYSLTRVEGGILFFMLLLFFFFCIRDVKKNSHSLEFVEEDIVPDLEARGQAGYKKWVKPVSALIAGLGCLILGSKLMVTYGSILGEDLLGFSPKLIGLFVFAVGTSLPELAISLMAAVKKEKDIALGNVIGSNIFNIFCVGGLVSIVQPMEISNEVVNRHLMMMLGMTLLLLAFLRIGRVVNRIEGGIFVAGYLFYCYVAVAIW